MEYITFMHGNVDGPPTNDEWERFFELARRSGLFRGGSAIGARTTVGEKDVPSVVDHIEGYMRFDADSLDELRALLLQHPVVRNGGTIEICELPKT